MIFASIEFLFRFLPLFLLIYFLFPPKLRNGVLFVGSMIFYACGEPGHIPFLLVSMILNHGVARKIYDLSAGEGWEWKAKELRRGLLVFILLYDFGILFVFKYLDFMIEMVNGIAGKELLAVTEIKLPLGISFYTFQMVSYVIDVYRREYRPAAGLLPFATYVVMFPQLIAGPIVNYGEVKDNLKKRKVNVQGIEKGLELFILGLAYKVLLADKISSLWNDIQIIGVRGINTPTAWLGAWSYSFQIYFDFFGYSLMAIGLGLMIGFRFPANFRSPYCCKSATDFWRHWHITLGRWFRSYVYIPLGGNRRGTARMVWNTLIVWTFTGLWHGAGWNFVLWGLFFFVILMVEKFFLLNYLDRSRIVGHLYMFILIPFSWMIFNMTDLEALGLYLSRMLALPVPESILKDGWSGMEKFLQLVYTYGSLLLICSFCATPIPLKLMKRFHRIWVVRLLLLALFWFSVAQLFQGRENPFLYFRF